MSITNSILYADKESLWCRSMSHSTWAWILKGTNSRCMKKRKKFCSLREKRKTRENNAPAHDNVDHIHDVLSEPGW